MNFLAHHAVAMQVEPDASPTFVVGNVLPDLVSTSGGRLRKHHVGTSAMTDDLTRGIRLHLETDRHFHGSSAFSDACAEAKVALLAVPFAIPLARVFFLAHVAVEIALDGLLMRESVALADDFYARFAAADFDEVAERTRVLLGSPDTLPNLARTLTWFAEHQYLYDYATAEGQAEALSRLSARVGLPEFAGEDRALLAEFFDTFTPALALYRDDLLTPPAGHAAMIQ